MFNEDIVEKLCVMDSWWGFETIAYWLAALTAIRHCLKHQIWRTQFGRSVAHRHEEQATVGRVETVVRHDGELIVRVQDGADNLFANRLNAKEVMLKKSVQTSQWRVQL